MRQHGVADFPDPQVTATAGSVSIRQVAPQSAVSSPAFQTSQKACRGILPGPQNGRQVDHGGPKKQTLLAFARCLRAHGVNGFPDPNAQGQLTLEMIRTAGVDLHAPGILTAGRACLGVTHGAITMAQLAQAVNGSH